MKYNAWMDEVIEDGLLIREAVREKIIEIINDYTPEGAAAEIMDLYDTVCYEY
jgi:hypothetical protein